MSSFLGAINIQTGYAQNFVVRTRNEFARQGLIVAVVDAPSDNPKGINAVFRMSSEHAEDIKAVFPT